MRGQGFVLPLLALGLAGFIAYDMLASIPRPAAPEPTTDAPSTILDEPRTEEEPRDDTSDAPRATPSPTPVCRAPADLLVRVLDPITRSGLAGIRCSVFAESDAIYSLSRTPLATGTTGENGEILFEDLASGGILVTTPRDPPRAASWTAMWIEGGSVGVCEIVLGFGGVLYGRVVDDSGSPVPDLEIELGPTEREVLDDRATEGFGTLVARTDAGGRFRIESLLSLPDCLVQFGEVVWYEREPVRLYFGPFAPRLAVDRPFHVLEREDISIGDWVVERERVLAGKVVGGDGRGIGAALVSANRKRLDFAHAPSELRAGPGTPEFALLSGETRTLADGSFELRVRGDVDSALVWTERGARGHFPIPRIEPGVRMEGITWELERDELLEVALRGVGGKPWQEAPNVVLESTSGERASLPLESDADGIYRWTLPFGREELAVLHVELPNHAETRVDGEVLRAGGLVAIELEAFPVVHLDLVAPRDDVESKEFEVTTCRLPPDERARWGCCGYGNTVETVIRTEGDCSIPVDVVASGASVQWVYVRCMYVRRGDWRPEFDTSAYGPFTPGEERIPLGLLRLVPDGAPHVEVDDDGDEAAPEYCEVELFAVDATTGELIGTGWPSPSAAAHIDALGRLLEKVDVESVTLAVAPHRYVRRDLELPPLRAGEIVRLGKIAFEREAGRPRIRIADPTGRSARRMVRILVSTPDFDVQFGYSWEGGSVPSRAVPESTAYLTAFAPVPSLHSVELPERMPEDVLELELPVSIPIEVRILGLPEVALRSPLTVVIAPLSFDGPVHGSRTRYDPIQLYLSKEFLPPAADCTRTYRGELGPGDYIVSVDGRWPAGGFGLKRIELTDQSGPQVVELRWVARSGD